MYRIGGGPVDWSKENCHVGPVSAAGLLQNHNDLVSGGWDTTIRVWDLKTGAHRKQIKGNHSPCVAIDPEERILAVGGGEKVDLWDTSTYARILTFGRFPGRVGSIVFHPVKPALLVSVGEHGGDPGKIELWKLVEKAPPSHGMSELDGERNGEPVEYTGASRCWSRRCDQRIASIGFSSDASTIALGTQEGRIQLISEDDGQVKTGWIGHGGAVKSLVFCPDCRSIVSGGTDRMVCLWEVSSGQQRRVFSGHRGAVTCVGLCSSGSRIVSGSEDTTLLVWELKGTGGERDFRESGSGQNGLDMLWERLAADHASVAYDAMCQLAEMGDGVVRLIRKHAPVSEKVDQGRIHHLIKELDSDVFADRQTAALELKGLGEPAIVAISEWLESDCSTEMRRRLRSLLRDLEARKDSNQLRLIRSIEVLEYIRSADAIGLLEKIGESTGDARVIAEARASVKRIKVSVP
jgi:hypothetical protein